MALHAQDLVEFCYTLQMGQYVGLSTLLLFSNNVIVLISSSNND